MREDCRSRTRPRPPLSLYLWFAGLTFVFWAMARWS
jgi:hypothetical protein